MWDRDNLMCWPDNADILLRCDFCDKGEVLKFSDGKVQVDDLIAALNSFKNAHGENICYLDGERRITLEK